MDGRIRGGYSRRPARHRDAGGSFQYRHAVCVRSGGRGCAHPSISGTGSASCFPGSRRTTGTHPHNLHVSASDGWPANHELDPILCLDDPWASALLFLWPETQHAEGRESRPRGIVECSVGHLPTNGTSENGSCCSPCSSFVPAAI